METVSILDLPKREAKLNVLSRLMLLYCDLTNTPDAEAMLDVCELIGYAIGKTSSIPCERVIEMWTKISCSAEYARAHKEHFARAKAVNKSPTAENKATEGTPKNE